MRSRPMLSLVLRLWLSLNERPVLFWPILSSVLYFVALADDLEFLNLKPPVVPTAASGE